ncbi:unnamed protein product, partial [Mesorhabditis belari]|uniref:Uncharacterized protein n=1 Tax=Mesorhabditis belari TaxID=2138241 RepID=A0AAF3F725_9BILA
MSEFCRLPGLASGTMVGLMDLRQIMLGSLYRNHGLPSLLQNYTRRWACGCGSVNECPPFVCKMPSKNYWTLI